VSLRRHLRFDRGVGWLGYCTEWNATQVLCDAFAGDLAMIYVLAALVPPLGLLLNGQPFSAIFNLVLIVFCAIFGLIFHTLLLVPSAHALVAVHMKREDRRHREVVEAIRQHGPPPGYPR
jgi:hypothetical protein